MPDTFEIFPAIGIARVGTSTSFFIGPEPDAPLDLRRRDGQRNLLRQAARFRVFQCQRDASGKLLSANEVTSAQGRIEWRVSIANRKAASQRFKSDSRRNNATGNDQQDHDLIIAPGEKRISAGSPPVELDGGAFRGQSVSLGRLEAEIGGRLLVIGGDGHSSSSTGAPLPESADFADNDDWHDNVGDGKVNASVTVGGVTTEALGGWVIVAPPDFAPEIDSVVTLYDVLFDLGVQRGLLTEPATIFYDQHVQPILQRANRMQWVNRQARLGFDDTQSGAHGPGGNGDFSQMPELGDDTQQNATRANIFRLLRDPASTAPFTPPAPRKRMPRLNDSNDSGNVLPLTRQQYRAMRLWSENNFRHSDPNPIAELLPDALTRVALQACSGGAFFPGIEAGRIMTDPTRYLANDPFRLSPAVVNPGDVTGRNAVPWQADFHLCRWEGETKLLAWWPAQRPDDVLQSAADDAVPLPWARGIPDTYQGMIEQWHLLGFVKSDPANPGAFLESDRVLP